jgi:transposase-like protein
MGRRYVKYSQEFRESALRRLALAPNMAQLCRELGVSRQLLYQWLAKVG